MINFRCPTRRLRTRKKLSFQCLLGVKWALTSCNFIRFCSWRTHSSKISFLTFLWKVETTRNSKTSENIGKAPSIRGSGGLKVSEVWLKCCSSRLSVFPVDETPLYQGEESIFKYMYNHVRPERTAAQLPLILLAPVRLTSSSMSRRAFGSSNHRGRARVECSESF